MIYLKRNGGVDHQIAPAKSVLIHGKKGPVKAVFGWPAIHTRIAQADQKEPQPKVDNLFLDCGARTKKEVENLGIHIGAVVTYEDGFDELANDYYIGRAFDNRIGGFMIAEVARLLKENQKEIALWFICGKCGSGRDRFARCRNDCPANKTGCCNYYRCNT